MRRELDTSERRRVALSPGGISQLCRAGRNLASVGRKCRLDSPASLTLRMSFLFVAFSTKSDVQSRDESSGGNERVARQSETQPSVEAGHRGEASVGYRGTGEAPHHGRVRPLTSKPPRRALAARRGARGQADTYRVTFVLGVGPTAYAALASFLARVRHWRESEVHEGDRTGHAQHGGRGRTARSSASRCAH